MTQEEKDLLLKDLCARLPYQLTVNWNPSEGVFKDIESNEHSNLEGWLIDAVKQGTIKPYLRPMSSMTEEETKEYSEIWINREPYMPGGTVDFFNAHHLDYRGLIPMDIALEAPEDMYKLNKDEVI